MKKGISVGTSVQLYASETTSRIISNFQKRIVVSLGVFLLDFLFLLEKKTEGF